MKASPGSAECTLFADRIAKSATTNSRGSMSSQGGAAEASALLSSAKLAERTQLL
jgi:hypothetical protein